MCAQRVYPMPAGMPHREPTLRRTRDLLRRPARDSILALDSHEGRSAVKSGYAALLCGGMLLATLPSAAHHSVAVNFDRGEPIEIRGIVKEVHLRNPHSQYVVAVAAQDGTVTDWFVEWSD